MIILDRFALFVYLNAMASKARFRNPGGNATTKGASLKPPTPRSRYDERLSSGIFSSHHLHAKTVRCFGGFFSLPFFLCSQSVVSLCSRCTLCYSAFGRDHHFLCPTSISLVK